MQLGFDRPSLATYHRGKIGSVATKENPVDVPGVPFDDLDQTQGR
jgi:hypothetical protein